MSLVYVAPKQLMFSSVKLSESICLRGAASGRSDNEALACDGSGLTVTGDRGAQAVCRYHGIKFGLPTPGYVAQLCQHRSPSRSSDEETKKAVER